MVHRIILPDLGQTSNEATILRWLRKEGQKVARGEALFEVETDKAVMEVEAYAGGYLREMLIGENQTACAGDVVAILTDDPEEEYEGAS